MNLFSREERYVVGPTTHVIIKSDANGQHYTSTEGWSGSDWVRISEIHGYPAYSKAFAHAQRMWLNAKKAGR